MVVVIKRIRRRLNLIAQSEHSYDLARPGDLLKQLKTLRGKIIKQAKHTIVAVSINDVLQKDLPFDSELKEKEIIKYVEENIGQLFNSEHTLFYFDVELARRSLSQNIWKLIAIDQAKLLARAQVLKQAGFKLKAVDVDQLAYQRGDEKSDLVADKRYFTALGLATWGLDDEH